MVSGGTFQQSLERDLQHADYFAGRKCSPIEVGLLHPADTILNAVGEDIRRRIFITADRQGRDLCLRPEFTIPVCLAHIKSGRQAKRYGYHGKVFRQRQEEPAEFRQVGIEDIGAKNRNTADARALKDAVELLRLHGKNRLTVSLGDQAIFEAVLKSMGLPKTWRERLGRAFGDPEKLAKDLDYLSGGASGDIAELPPKLKQALEKDDAEAATKIIRARMRENGLPLEGGRSAAEIAQRLMEKARLADTRLADEKREILELFLALELPLSSANRKLWSFARRFNIPLGNALEDFHRRCLAIEKLGLENVSVRYRAGFGRRLDYYTGFVFEISGSGSNTKPLAGGGRYDRLLNLLGSREKIPAVGFAVFLDRLQRKGEAK